MVVMDFSKAFDVVPHKKLLNKLDLHDIRESTFCWTEAFTTKIMQQVVADGKLSDVVPVTSGFPQGSMMV